VSKSVVCLADVRGPRPGWSQYELLQLHRTAKLLRDAGICLETDSGVTDEREPWFVLCDDESNEVIVHFARLSGMYVICSPFLKGSLSGGAFPDVIDRFLRRILGKR